jgi:hypothetical protein
VNDLKSLVALQARVYEFLEQQDEATLQAIASGTIQLGILGEGTAPGPPRSGRPLLPSSEPWQVVQDLSRLSTEDERRTYLNSTKLLVKELREVARSMGLRGYGNLAKAKLIALLAGNGSDQSNTNSSEQSTPIAPPSSQEDDAPETVPSEAASSPAELPRSDVDVVAIASHLRELETEEAGADYLHEQRLDRETLLEVAGELQLTRVTRLSQNELEKRVLKQAIGARRKFAGLRKW